MYGFSLFIISLNIYRGPETLSSFKHVARHANVDGGWGLGSTHMGQKGFHQKQTPDLSVILHVRHP